MITEVTGSIFDADVEALVNPVNCVGVMGAGLAKQFKEKYPDYFRAYKENCISGDLLLNSVITYRTNLDTNPRYIISFPTKRHFKDRSTVDIIKGGLKDLRFTIEGYTISSIAVPALGCGCGGLDWKEVKPLIYAVLDDLQDTRILLYPPQENL